MTGTDIGGRVRTAREQRGLTLADAAQVTKLPTCVLRAIERNDFASLPTGIYRKAYLLTLAAEVGLDTSEVAAEYETQYAQAEHPPVTHAPRDRWRQLLAPGLAIAVILAVVLLAAWVARQRDGEPAGTAPAAHSSAQHVVKTP